MASIYTSCAMHPYFKIRFSQLKYKVINNVEILKGHKVSIFFSLISHLIQVGMNWRNESWYHFPMWNFYQTMLILAPVKLDNLAIWVFTLFSVTFWFVPSADTILASQEIALPFLKITDITFPGPFLYISCTLLFLPNVLKIFLLLRSFRIRN